MSDFGDFNSSSDPTADFLARERAVLGDDADLFSSGDVGATASSAAPVADLMSSPPSATTPAPFSPSQQEPQPAAAAAAVGDYSAFEQEYPKAEELETSHASINIIFVRLVIMLNITMF